MMHDNPNSPERDALLRAEYEAGVSMEDILEHINALPGIRMSSGALLHRARKCHIRRSVTFRSEVARVARYAYERERRTGGLLEPDPLTGKAVTKVGPVKEDPPLQALRAPRDGGVSVANTLMREAEMAGTLAPADRETVTDWGARYCPEASGSLNVINRARHEYGLPQFILERC